MKYTKNRKKKIELPTEQALSPQSFFNSKFLTKFIKGGRIQMYKSTRNVSSFFFFFLELCRIHAATLTAPNFGSKACYCCCLCININ